LDLLNGPFAFLWLPFDRTFLLLGGSSLCLNEFFLVLVKLDQLFFNLSEFLF
jgi:hypothetical protein